MNRCGHRNSALALLLVLILLLTGVPAGADAREPLVYDQIVLNKTTIAIELDSAVQTLFALNEAEGYEAIIWTSSAPDQVDYNANSRRLVPKIDGGRATITARGSRSGVVATCEVMVRNIPVTSVRFRKTSGKLAVSSTYNMNSLLTVSPADATIRDISWSSGNEAVAEIGEDGIVHVVGEGVTNIVATSVENPALAAAFKLTGQAVRVKSVALNRKNATVDPEEGFALIATVLPANASFKTVVWSSDNEAIAKVDEAGKVSALAPGKAIISAATDNGRAIARMVVRVRGGSMRTVKVSAMGDVVLGGDKKYVKKADKPIGDGLTSWKRFERLYYQYGAPYFFAGVKNVLEKDDLSIINLEGTLTNKSKAASKTYAFKGRPEYASVLTQGSIEVANLANNHSMDYLASGYSDTRKNLNRVGISAIGFGSSGITTRVVNGVRVGFASFNIPTSKGDITSAINKLRKNKKCEIVIVQFHWSHSKEWTNKISTQEKTLARHAVTKGADLVVGHHKHQISGIERYKDKMIAYDVGNFVTMIRNSINGKILDKASMVYQQKFNIFDDGFVEVCDPNLVPVMISDSQEVLTGNPRIVEGAEADRVLGLVRSRTPATSLSLVNYDPDY